MSTTPVFGTTFAAAAVFVFTLALVVRLFSNFLPFALERFRFFSEHDEVSGHAFFPTFFRRAWAVALCVAVLAFLATLTFGALQFFRFFVFG